MIFLYSPLYISRQISSLIWSLYHNTSILSQTFNSRFLITNQRVYDGVRLVSSSEILKFYLRLIFSCVCTSPTVAFLMTFIYNFPNHLVNLTDQAFNFNANIKCFL